MARAYSTPEKLMSLSIRKAALSSLSREIQMDALVSASEFANGFIGTQYGTLTDWGSDLEQCVCDIATWRLLKTRGLNPAQNEAEVFRISYDDAVDWLKGIASGKIHPPGFVDSTPDEQEYGVAAETNCASKWG